MIPYQEQKEKFLTKLRQVILQFTNKSLEELEERHQRDENDYFKFKCLINAVKNSTDNIKDIKDIKEALKKMEEYQKGIMEVTLELQMREVYSTLDAFEKLDRGEQL